MPFVAINSAVIESGDPVTQELWGLVQDNFDDHEARIVDLEGGGAIPFIPVEFECDGYVEDYAGTKFMGTWRVPFDIDILAGRLRIVKAGTSGTTQIDFEYKRGANPWTSIFATKPSVSYLAGDNAISTNGVLNVLSLQAGDIVRLNIDTAQVASWGIVGFIEYEKG